MSSTVPPEGDPAPDAGLRLVLPGRRESAGAGWTWVAQGWKLFTRAWVMWVISVVLLFIIAVAMSLVPFLGSLAFQVLQSVLMAGFVVACRSLETGGEFELEHLFAGFQRRFGPLLVVGLILLGGWLAIMLVFAVFVGFSVLGAFMTGDPEAVVATMSAALLPLVIGSLVMLGLMVPLLAAYWFAPSLVVMHGLGPVEAMKASFFACLRNFVPFIVYGLAMFVLLIVAMIPFGLGLLVWVPLAISSTYVAYRRIFTEEAAPPPA